MTEERFLEIREKYLERYPHLGAIEYPEVNPESARRIFARNALRLAAPRRVTVKEIDDLAKLC